MNLDMIRPRNETEDLSLSITKHCEKLREQTDKKTTRNIRNLTYQPKRNVLFQSTLQD